jgi:hypothetical protein
MPLDKEKRKEYMKAYRERNKESKKEYDKQYREKNKEKIKEQKKAYREKNPKVYIKLEWKKSGLIHDNYDELYDKYCASKNCEECGCEYSKKGDGIGNFKCMDHDHLTGEFRNFLCHKCNIIRG